VIGSGKERVFPNTVLWLATILVPKRTTL